MNIFMLDKNPRLAAYYHHNKHVVKMILESCQLLSTAHRILDGDLEYITSKNTGRKIRHYKLNDNREHILYKACHFNHPSNVWVRKSSGNYEYLYQLLIGLVDEYHNRFNHKAHKSETLLEMLQYKPDNIPFGILEFPKQNLQAMPNIYKDKNAIIAYRNYYVMDKPLVYYKLENNQRVDLPIPEVILKHKLKYQSMPI